MDRSKKIDYVKTATSLVVGHSVSAVMSTILTNNIDTPETRKQKLEVKIGCYAIGGMVGKAAKRHTDQQIDSIVKTYDKIKSKFTEATE